MINGNHGKKYAIISEELYKTLRNMNQQTEQRQSPLFQKIKLLDDQIKKILTSKTLTAGQKAKMYSQIASQYIDLRNKAPETSRTEYQALTSTHPPHMLAEETEPVQEQAEQVEPVDQLMEDTVEARLPANEDDDLFLDAPHDQEIPMAFARPVIFSPSQSEEGVMDRKQIVNSMGSDVRKARAKLLLDEVLKNKEKISWNENTGVLQLNGKEVPDTSVTNIIDYISNHKPAKGKAPPGVTRFLRAMKLAKIDPSLIPNTELRNIMEQKGHGQVYKVKWETLD